MCKPLDQETINSLFRKYWGKGNNKEELEKKILRHNLRTKNVGHENISQDLNY